MPQEFENDTTDILDATQNAVIDAVNSVSEMIEKTAIEGTFSAPEKAEPFYQSAEFWVGVAFVLVVVFLFKPVSSALKKLLSARRNRIISELEDAASLQDEAQKLLARYERQYLNTKSEVRQIIDQTESELSAYRQRKTDELENELFKKQKEANLIIETAIDKTRSEMNTAISKKTIEIVTKRLQSGLTKKERSDLIDRSITNILKTL
ncbi:MAG: ATP synthase F0 subunit B [Alphaproteobacteria bacterium]|nr:ATP synthase F0 subunit B [Alphaproteobacteria bacterium]